MNPFNRSNHHQGSHNQGSHNQGSHNQGSHNHAPHEHAPHDHAPHARDVYEVSNVQDDLNDDDLNDDDLFDQAHTRQAHTRMRLEHHHDEQRDNDPRNTDQEQTWTVTTADDGCRLDRLLAGRLSSCTTKTIKRLFEQEAVRVAKIRYVGEHRQHATSIMPVMSTAPVVSTASVMSTKSSKSAISDASVATRAGGDEHVKTRFLIVKPSYRVVSGDIVYVRHTQTHHATALLPAPELHALPLLVLYEDDHLIVVNKPPEQAMYPSLQHPSGTLVSAVLAHCDVQTLPCWDPVRPGVVHRLDIGTSGAVVLAKSDAAFTGLTLMIARREVVRCYHALLAGIPHPLQGRIDSLLARNLRRRHTFRSLPLHTPDPPAHARRALSTYEIIETWPSQQHSLTVWRLQTGRTHQIRAHVESLKTLIVGDRAYGWKVPAPSKLSNLSTSSMLPKAHAMPLVQVMQAAPTSLSNVSHPLLHASLLAFTHPVTGVVIRIHAPFPPTWHNALLGLGSTHDSAARILSMWGGLLDPITASTSPYISSST